MTYSEASKRLQEYTGKPLLESLEFMENVQHPTPADVRVAFHTLMAGFSEMFA